MTPESRFDEGRKMVRPGRVEIFVDRFYGTAEELESPANCPKCGEPMPLRAAFTGPTCPNIYGGCGFVPKDSKFKYKMKSDEKGEDNA